MAFGTDLRKMRLHKGFKLREFAKMADISPTYLSLLEREKTLPPSAETITRIAILLGINPDVTCLRAGRTPVWIKELMNSDQAIFCVDAFINIRDGIYARDIFQKIGK